MQLQQFGESTVGEVLEVSWGSTPHGRPGGGRSTYRPVTDQLLGGVVVTKDWKDYASTRQGLWAVGQQLTLRYGPAKYRSVSIDTPESSGLLTNKVENHFLLLKGVFAATLVGPAVLIAARRIGPPRRKCRLGR